MGSVMASLGFGPRRRASLSALNSSFAIIHFTPEGVIEWANPAFCSAMGYRLDDLTGRHHRIFMPQGAAEGADYAQFWRSLARGEANHATVERRTSAGETIFIDAVYQPVLDRSGRVERIVKLARDVTAEVAARRRDRALIEAVSETHAVIEFDLDTVIRDANDAFCETLGYGRGEIIGRKHEMFAPPEMARSAEYARFWERLRAGESFSAEFERRGKGGREVWINATYAPVRDEHGAVVGVVKFAKDITEDVKARS